MSLALPRRALLLAASVVVAVAAGRHAARDGSRAGTGRHPAAGRQTRVNEDAQLIGEFLERVEAYLAVHKKADSTLPEATNRGASAEIDAHERALQRLIARRPQQGQSRRHLHASRSAPTSAARSPGPSPALTARRSAARSWTRTPARSSCASNGRYPDTVPLSTMPPQILAALPKLPEELEYRFIGDRLILLDVHAQLVVDYMDDAIRELAGVRPLPMVFRSVRPVALWLLASGLVVGACIAASRPIGTAAVLAQTASDRADRRRAAPPTTLPNRDGSLKFGVLGDFGTGKREQYQLGEQMATFREQFPFELVITVGDNLYGGNGPRTSRRSSRRPTRRCSTPR